MKLTTGLLAAAIALATAPAFATDTGFYVGAGMGYSKISINETKIDNSIDATIAPWFVDKSSVDQNATPYSFFVGYRLMPYLAAEVAYLDMGQASYTGTIAKAATTGTGKVKGTWSADGWPLSVLGIWPVNDTWEVFGRVGVFMGNVDLTAHAYDSAAAPLGRAHASDSSTEFFGGVGVDANFMESWAARFEWQAMPSIGNDDTGSGNFNNFMFSILYKF
jgi:opacity protein-like surface antigen